MRYRPITGRSCRARWYDPNTGRFINEDPAQDGSNWYAYAGNDPINNYDPTGLSVAKPTDNFYAGGYSGGKIAPAPKLNPNLLNSPTRDYSPFGNSALSYSAPSYGPSYSTPKVSSPSSTSVPNFRVNDFSKNLITGQPTNRSGNVNTVALPPHLQTPKFSRIEDLEKQRAASALQQYGREQTAAAWEAQAQQMRATAGPHLRPDGSLVPTIRGITREEYDRGRLNDLGRMVSTNQIMTPGERHEYDKLSIAYAGPLERFAIVEGALAGFAGGYTPRGTGTLNVYEPPSQVRVQAAPNRLGTAYSVGEYNALRKVAETGLNAHHVGQQAAMKKLVPNYNPSTAPSILVPRVGHTVRTPDGGVVSRSTEGFTTARQVIARDIRELRRVYPDIPNQQLQQLIELNKEAYPILRSKP